MEETRQQEEHDGNINQRKRLISIKTTIVFFYKFLLYRSKRMGVTVKRYVKEVIFRRWAVMQTLESFLICHGVRDERRIISSAHDEIGSFWGS